MLGVTEILLRLGVATLAGCLIGVDREVRAKPSGVRTLGLVGMGAALAVLSASGFSAELDRAGTSRVVQGIVTGIGFLGAGVIIKGRREPHIQGLTTAASIWTTACLGVACGLGAWAAVGVSLGLMLALLLGGLAVDQMIQRNEGANHDASDTSGASTRRGR